MRKSGMEEVYEIRKTLEQVLKEGEVSLKTGEAARKALEARFHGASEQGFTQADVVRSVLSPVLGPKQRCDCPTCRFRRGELRQAAPGTTSDW